MSEFYRFMLGIVFGFAASQSAGAVMNTEYERTTRILSFIIQSFVGWAAGLISWRVGTPPQPEPGRAACAPVPATETVS